FPVVRNGLPSNIGASGSSSISIITKSAGKSVLSTVTSTSSKIPYGWTLVRSTRMNVILVSLTSPQFSFFRMESGIKLTLAPRSSSDLPIYTPPIVHGIVKLPGSLHL
ncbi:hypothetical protein A2U01_0029996, partial [Trifolium medium]|nr:hypothetical protein [Trifolium medium]